MKDIVDKLLQCRLHFITTYPYQNMEKFCDVDTFFGELERLYDHPGWPSGDKLLCPIFHQDKFNYLTQLYDFCNPTLLIPLKHELDMENVS